MLDTELAMLRASRSGERNGLYASIRRKIARAARVDPGLDEAIRQAAIQGGPDNLWFRRSIQRT